MKKSESAVTPLQKTPDLAASVGFSEMYFKREDLHPYGSHKGRSIPVMIDTYVENGDRTFALSSSGNAALAAALHIHGLNEKRAKESPDLIDLTIFVGNNVSATKLAKIKKLEDDHIRVLLKERPLQALTEAVNEGARSLRQSTDDTALIGYESLARELEETHESADGPIGAVFVGTSSGTTAQALAQYFIDHNLPIEVHIVQTSSCHPMSEAFESYDGPDERSSADAIVDITAVRKNKLIDLIEQTNGHGWTATNEDISAAMKLVEDTTGLQISTNSALSVAGAMKAAYVGREIEGAVVCLICGD